MAKIDINSRVIKIFKEATSGNPAHENNMLEVFPISGEIFGKMSIILFKKGKSLPEGKIPNDTLFIPVEIKAREGYITDSKTADILAKELS